MKIRLGFLFLIISIVLPSILSAQSYKEVTKTQRKSLKQLASKLHDEHEKNFKQAKLFAEKRGLPLRTVDSKGNIIAVHRIDANGMLVYVTTNSNIKSAVTIGTAKVWPGGSTGFSLSGSSSILRDKLAIWDGGQPLFTHREFQSRIKSGDETTDSQDHSTHVGGTMIAAGLNPAAKGMAFKAPSLIGFDFNNDDAEMATAVAKYGLLVSNHSYGNIAGWYFRESRAGTDTDPNWEWYGEDGKFEDYKFGDYDASVAAWDDISFKSPYYLIVKSAGNNQNQNGPDIGQPYYQRNAAGNFTLRSARVQGAISSNDSYDNLSTNCNAKNILVVGAIYGLDNGYTKASDVRLAPFSSWGPTDDGRIKPDIVANGINVLSTLAGSDDDYGILSGTSMAAPSVAGSALLLQEQFSKFNNGNFMRSATLKGLIIHTADEAGNAAGPDYKMGWGVMNTANAATLIAENGKYSIISEQVLQQGKSYELKVIASGREPLSVSISWTDPAATATPDGTVDDLSSKLLNDLDVRVTKGSDVFQPWILDPSNPANNASKGDNFRDNVEKILIDNTEPGETYTITVTHKNTLQNRQQAFSLIATGVGGNAYCTSAATGTTGLKIGSVKIGNFNNTSSACSGYSSYLNNPALAEPGQTLPINVVLNACSASTNGFVKLFVDWNGNGSFDDSGEAVATSSLLNASGQFNTNISIPSTVNVGDILRMRLVLTETSQSASVLACGNYLKGETEDYALKITPPSNDVGVSALVSPENFSCANNVMKVAVSVKNYGSKSASAIPVAVEISANGTLVKKLTGTINEVLSPDAETNFIFNESFVTVSGASYLFKCYTGLTTDQVRSNDSIRTAVSIAVNPEAPQLNFIACDDEGLLLRSSVTDGTVYWFDSATSSNPIAVGNNAYVSTKPSVIYGALNDFSGKVGPTTRTVYGSGDNAYNQFTPSVRLTVNAPIVLQRARLYIGHSGTITFTVTDEQTGVEVSSVKLNVKATRNPEAAGSQPTVSNDQGAVYDLNLKIPTVGNYLINIAYENDATIFRNKQDTPISYPISIPGVLDITGNTASISGTTGPDNYWYYFYDMEVKALGCVSPRSVATLQKVEITLNNDILTANVEGSMQWFLNDVPIEGATGPTYTPIHSGVYIVKLVDNCSATSNEIAYQLPNVPKDIGLKLYPVPTSEDVTVQFNVWEPSKVRVSIINALGQLFVDETASSFSGYMNKNYRLDGFNPGVYFVRVIINNEVYSDKLTVIK
ncbi:S8 family serine peptidase [Solitalea sp. MAHUQ-68]|uniref:S8 family serine peptidase n=1 Tax=Solitalea agri TaxID=2953739 RepID=A0A9X2F8G3_9SPHI|nr:S8 family serine peptidase [Solitalea agri]MCO4293673.1 S8 family serine peptidase [Solitalea agri]